MAGGGGGHPLRGNFPLIDIFYSLCLPLSFFHSFGEEGESSDNGIDEIDPQDFLYRKHRYIVLRSVGI